MVASYTSGRRGEINSVNGLNIVPQRLEQAQYL
jgi:hypothetical protein